MAPKKRRIEQFEESIGTTGEGKALEELRQGFHAKTSTQGRNSALGWYSALAKAKNWGSGFPLTLERVEMFAAYLKTSGLLAGGSMAAYVSHIRTESTLGGDPPLQETAYLKMETLLPVGQGRNNLT